MIASTLRQKTPAITSCSDIVVMIDATVIGDVIAVVAVTTNTGSGVSGFGVVVVGIVLVVVVSVVDCGL